VKAIRENWQFTEEYLRKKRKEQRKEEEEKIEYIKAKMQEEIESRFIIRLNLHNGNR